jgi:hypothetical protein
MPSAHSRLKRQASRVLVLLTACLLPLQAAFSQANDVTWFYLRNYNPFLQVNGIAPFQPARLVDAGKGSFLVNLEIANNADTDEEPDESVILDGESYFLTLAYRNRVSQWLELGLDLPFVSHTGGSLDPAIKNWHSILGISNTKRNGPTNELHFMYSGTAATGIDLQDSASGLRDILLSAALPLRRSPTTGQATLSLRLTAKLPTGDESDLLGSGAGDYSLGLHQDGSWSVGDKTLQMTGFAGLLMLGDGGVLSGIRRDRAAYAGAGAAWPLTERLSVVSQLHYQQSYYDTNLEELGGKTLQLAVGGTYRPARWPLILTFGVVEDIFGDATPDVVLHAGVRWAASRRQE